MDIETVNGIIESLNNHYSTQRTHVYHNQSKAISSKRINALSLSASATNISEIYESLRKTGNETAMAAFRDTMVKFSQRGSGEDFVHFTHTMEDVSKASPNLLQKVFSTVSDIEKRSIERNLSLDAVAWLSNLGYLSEGEIESYIDNTETIISSDTDVDLSFHDFVTTTSSTVKE